MYVKSFKELEVYKFSRKVSFNIFELTKSFPKEEKYSLVDQIRRSSRSVGAQIAEAWAKRKYKKHFISKLTDADAEQLETVHWLEISLECGYADKATFTELIKDCNSIGKMLYVMIDKSTTFCKK